jgi:MoaA/NifB/PqqE/SkfB family radical SAM enzyme
LTGINANLALEGTGEIAIMHPRLLPERLNLAIARRCEVACGGCYTYFGREEPNLAKFVSSVAAFVRLGLSEVTLSGGDPLTIAGLPDFLATLRSVGVRSIKLDTVGVSLASPTSGAQVHLHDLAARTDYIGIPLDGWSDESALEFRRGRKRLHTETVGLLAAFDALGGPPKVIINTVAHRGNLPNLERIHAELTEHSCLCQWNIFQYTPTDQAARGANQHYVISDEAFERCREWLFGRLASARSPGSSFLIDFRSNRSRVGQYLLVNSDGDAWLPDEVGRTLRLGSVFGREDEVLGNWSETATSLFRRSGVPKTPQTLLHSTKT